MYQAAGGGLSSSEIGRAGLSSPPKLTQAHGTLAIMTKIPGISQATGNYPRHRRYHVPDTVRVGLLVLGWLTVAVLGLIALLRLVAWDSLEPLIVLDALTLIVYLPAWVVAVVALIARRWWLAGAAIVIVAAQLAFVMPELLAAAPVPAWAQACSDGAGVRRERRQELPLRSRLRASHPAGPSGPYNPRRVHAAGAVEDGGLGRAGGLPLQLRRAGLRRDRLPDRLQAAPDRLPGTDRDMGR